MKALSLAYKDLQVFFRDRGAVLQLLLLPLIFILVFSGALASIGQTEPELTRLPLAVVDLDGGAAAETLLEGLADTGGLQIEQYSEEEAQSLLEKKAIPRVLTVPADFSAGVDAGRAATLRLVNHPDAVREETEAIRLIVEGVARDMSLESQILASLQQMGDMQANAPEEFQVFTTERIVAQARAQMESAETRPLVAVDQKVAGQEEERESTPGLDDVAVPGFTVLFVFLTAQTTARSIYSEKKGGSFRRLLAAPISRPALLTGKLIPNFVTALVQTGVIFTFGTVGLRLLGLKPLPLENAPLGVAVVSVLIALCSSTLGIVIAALAHTENQIGGLSTLVLWGMGFIGGCIAPLFILEQFLGPLPKIVPHYWANRAFEDLLIRGLGFSDVVPEIGVLLVFSAVFLAFGLWRFDFD